MSETANNAIDAIDAQFTIAADDAPAGFSRDPADYRPTDYFLVRARRSIGPIGETRRDPPISGEVIESCIREGELRRGREPRWILIAEVDGTEWWLVVGIHSDHSNDVLTAYAPAYHDVSTVHIGGDH